MQLTQMHSKQLFKQQHLLLLQPLPKEKRLLRKKKRNLRKHQNPSMSQMKTWDLDFLTKISSTVPCNIMGRDFFLSNAKANGTVSAKIAPRLKCYKNASRLNRYNIPTDNAIDFLFSTLHTTPFHYEVLKIGSR